MNNELNRDILRLAALLFETDRQPACVLRLVRHKISSPNPAPIFKLFDYIILEREMYSP